MRDTTSDTIGMTELLDEVSRDLDELRKKSPGDYSMKTIVMWWDLERDRLVARHTPNGVVKRLRRVRSMKRLLVAFSAGWLAMLVIDTTIRLLVR
jgi:hypothetical protein